VTAAGWNRERTATETVLWLGEQQQQNEDLDRGRGPQKFKMCVCLCRGCIKCPLRPTGLPDLLNLELQTCAPKRLPGPRFFPKHARGANTARLEPCRNSRGWYSCWQDAASARATTCLARTPRSSMQAVRYQVGSRRACSGGPAAARTRGQAISCCSCRRPVDK
jgi:hypothetical protein